MASTTAFPTSFKQELFEGVHDFQVAGNTFNMSLYTSTAVNDATTVAYTSTNELPTATGYTQTGQALTNIAPTVSGTTAFVDFVDESWTSASFTAASCLIYNDTDAGKGAVYVGDFGGDKTVTSGTFTVQFPVADASNAIIRIA
jgi:hypothetical protein